MMVKSARASYKLRPFPQGPGDPSVEGIEEWPHHQTGNASHTRARPNPARQNSQSSRHLRNLDSGRVREKTGSAEEPESIGRAVGHRRSGARRLFDFDRTSGPACEAMHDTCPSPGRQDGTPERVDARDGPARYCKSTSLALDRRQPQSAPEKQVARGRSRRHYFGEVAAPDSLLMDGQ